MAIYELLGTKVAFSDAEERFLDLFYKERKAAYEARDRYQTWYKQTGSISAWNLLTLDGTVIPPLLDDGSTPQPKPAIPAAVPDAPTESQENPFGAAI